MLIFQRAHMVSARARGERAYAMILNGCNTFRSVPFEPLHLINPSRLCGIHIMGARALQKPYYCVCIMSSTLLIQLISIISKRLCHQLLITGSWLLLGVIFEAFLTHALWEMLEPLRITRIIKDAHASRLSTQITINPSSSIIISVGRPSHRNSSFVHT